MSPADPDVAADPEAPRAQPPNAPPSPRDPSPGLSARVLDPLGRALRGLARPHRLLLLAALVGLSYLYFSNDDMGGDPRSPRGDGRYRPVLARGDGHMMFLMARSMVFDRDLRFDNDLARFGDPWRQGRTKTGRKLIPHPIGPPLVWAPVLGLAHWVSKAANRFGAKIPGHGYTLFHHRFLFFTSVLFAFGAVLIGYRVARRWVGAAWGPAYAAVAILFGTSLTYYATYMPSYGHALDAFVVAAFLGYFALSFGERRLWRFVWLGLLLGLCALVRVQNFALGVALAVELCVAMTRPTAAGTPRWRHAVDLALRGALTLAVAVLAFIPQLLAWKAVYGEYLVPTPATVVHLGHPQLLEILFSSKNGWLSTTPLAYLAVLGLLFVPRRARLVTACLVAALAVQVWMNSSIIDWWGMASYGARRLCSVTLVLVVGLAALLRAGRLAVRRLPARCLPARCLPARCLPARCLPARCLPARCLPARCLPAVVAHTGALVLLTWFVVWNVAWVNALRGGKAAGRRAGPSCCRGVPRPLARLAQPIYDRLGNPFSFPASALFALRHHVPLGRWDLAVGEHVYFPDPMAYKAGRHRLHRYGWGLSGPGGAPYLLRGWGPPQRSPLVGWYRWTTAPRASGFVPLLLPEAHRLWVSLQPHGAPGAPPVLVRLRWNGALLAAHSLPPGRFTTILLEVPGSRMVVGNNLLTIESPMGPPPAAPAAPRGHRTVGVALGRLVVGFPPSPFWQAP